MRGVCSLLHLHLICSISIQRLILPFPSSDLCLGSHDDSLLELSSPPTFSLLLYDGVGLVCIALHDTKVMSFILVSSRSEIEILYSFEDQQKEIKERGDLSSSLETKAELFMSDILSA